MKMNMVISLSLLLLFTIIIAVVVVILFCKEKYKDLSEGKYLLTNQTDFDILVKSENGSYYDILKGTSGYLNNYGDSGPLYIYDPSSRRLGWLATIYYGFDDNGDLKYCDANPGAEEPEYYCSSNQMINPRTIWSITNCSLGYCLRNKVPSGQTTMINIDSSFKGAVSQRAKKVNYKSFSFAFKNKYTYIHKELKYHN